MFYTSGLHHRPKLCTVCISPKTASSERVLRQEEADSKAAALAAAKEEAAAAAEAAALAEANKPKPKSLFSWFDASSDADGNVVDPFTINADSRGDIVVGALWNGAGAIIHHHGEQVVMLKTHVIPVIIGDFDLNIEEVIGGK